MSSAWTTWWLKRAFNAIKGSWPLLLWCAEEFAIAGHFSFQVEERAARGVTRVFEESLLRGRFKSEIGTCHQVIFYWLCFWLESNWIQSYETRVRKWAVEWSIFIVFHDLKEFSCQKQDRRNSFKIDHKPNIIESSRKSILGRLIIFIALSTPSLCAW